ncbi:hypothetical protein BGW80DRAFT_582520 [Lactifluus volemus]|nr:hypothetical protein BGW80DRAFT_582520 [Lactifluus volemus]
MVCECVSVSVLKKIVNQNQQPINPSRKTQKIKVECANQKSSDEASFVNRSLRWRWRQIFMPFQHRKPAQSLAWRYTRKTSTGRRDRRKRYLSETEAAPDIVPVPRPDPWAPPRGADTRHALVLYDARVGIGIGVHHSGGGDGGAASRVSSRVCEQRFDDAETIRDQAHLTPRVSVQWKPYRSGGRERCLLRRRHGLVEVKRRPIEGFERSMVLPTRVSRQPFGSAGSRFRKDTSCTVSPSMPLTFFPRNPNSELSAVDGDVVRL